jgi:hypothetical protein
LESERRDVRSFRLPPYLRLAFVLAVFAGFTWRLIARTLESSVNIPFWDQWDFYTPLFNHASLWRIFIWQHGPHREGIGLVADKFLLEWTHWNARAESLLIVGCFCTAAVFAMYLKVKLIGPLTYSDGVIPAMFLMPAHLGAITGVANPSYSGFPELLIFLYCLAWTLRDPLLRYAAVLLLNFLLIYTGFGFFIGIATIVVLLVELRRGLKANSGLLAPVAALAIAALSFASFFWRYQNAPAKLVRCVEHPHVLNYPWFVALALALFLGMRRAIVLATIVGSASALALIWVACWHASNLVNRREWSNRDLVIAILASFSLLFVIAAALGRACLGMPSAAQNYRYLGLLVPGFLAGYFQLQLIPNAGRRILAVAIFVIAVIPPSLRNHTDLIAENGKRAWIACLSRGGSIPHCQQSTGFTLHSDPGRTHLEEKLDYLRRNRLSFYAQSSLSEPNYVP